MTSQGNGQPIYYHISISENVRNTIKELHAYAVHLGKATEFLSAFRQILDRLGRDPRGFGEALYRLSTLDLTIFLGGIGPLFVNFGVHGKQPIVFVQNFKSLL